MRNGIGENSTRVSPVTSNGVWLEVGNSRYFLGEPDYPWFRDRPEAFVKTVAQDPYPNPTIRMTASFALTTAGSPESTSVTLQPR